MPVCCAGSTTGGLAVLIADNFAVEAVPPREVAEGRAYEGLHELCLFKLGIHLGEMWHLGELNAWLRAAGRTRFLLTAPPLRLPGAVGVSRDADCDGLIRMACLCIPPPP